MEWTPPTWEASDLPDWSCVVVPTARGAVIKKVTTVGIDVAKNRFSVHGIDEHGMVLNLELSGLHQHFGEAPLERQVGLQIKMRTLLLVCHYFGAIGSRWLLLSAMLKELPFLMR